MPSLTAKRSRSRVVYVLAFVVVILLGLASRRYPTEISALFGKYPGDALWAGMVFFGLGTLLPRASTLGVAVLAFAVCLVVETMKLYQAPWIVGIRHTTLGHLIFGHVFSFQNLVAYVVGVVVALGVEVSWPYAGNGRASHASTQSSNGAA